AVAFCDADCEYDPAELERLVAPILEGRADYVVGSRFAGEIRRMLPQRRLGNLALTGLLRFVARAPIGDGQSGFRALSRAAAAEAEIVHDYNYAQVLTLDLLAKRHRYLEVPIGYRFRTTGRSFVRPLRYLRQVVPTVWRELDRHHRAAASPARPDPRPVQPASRLVHPAPRLVHPAPRLLHPAPPRPPGPAPRPPGPASRPPGPASRPPGLRLLPPRPALDPPRPAPHPPHPGPGPPVGERSRPLSWAREAVHRSHVTRFRGRDSVLDHVAGEPLAGRRPGGVVEGAVRGQGVGGGPGHGQGVVGVVVDEQAEAAEAEQGRLGGRPGVEGLERGGVADPVDRVDVGESADRHPADRSRVGEAAVAQGRPDQAGQRGVPGPPQGAVAGAGQPV